MTAETPPLRPQLRPITLADAPVLAKLEAAIFAVDAWTVEELTTFLQMHTVSGMLLLTPQGQPVGYALVRQVADEAEVLTIGVHPDQRGQGWGKILLETELARLIATGVAQVFLEVRASNKAAQALYHACGGKAIGWRRQYYPAAAGQPAEDARVYLFQLPPFVEGAPSP